MLDDRILNRFRDARAVPVVSGDPVDRPLGNWLGSGGSDPDTVLVGIPFDGATVVPSRKGAAGGPAAVRECLGDLNCYNLSLDIDLSEHLSALDLGDIPIDSGDAVRAVHDRTTSIMSDVIGTGTLPVSIGGDDSLCYAGARGLCRATTGRIGIIGFDAHLDMRVLYDEESSSGSSYRRLRDDFGDQVDAANLVHIGVNGWFAAKDYAVYAREQGITLITGDQVYERGMSDVVREALERASDGTDAIYVNFDMDVLDQHYAPGKVMRNPGGLRGRDAYVAARLVGRHPKVRYFALNEVNVNRDVSSFTALVGAYVIGYYWAGLACRMRDG